MAAKMKSRISPIEKVTMVFVALFLDLCSVIPFLNVLFALLAWLIFTLWFLSHGIPPRATYKIMSTAAFAFVIGFIPLFSIIPELTASIIIILITIEREDKKTHQQQATAQQKQEEAFAAARAQDDQDEQPGEEYIQAPARATQYRIEGDMLAEQETPRTKTMSLDGTTTMPEAITKEFSETIRHLDEMVRDRQQAFEPRNTLSFGSSSRVRGNPIGTNLPTVYDTKALKKNKTESTYVSGNEPSLTTSGKNLSPITQGGVGGGKSIGGFGGHHTDDNELGLAA